MRGVALHRKLLQIVLRHDLFKAIKPSNNIITYALNGINRNFMYCSRMSANGLPDLIIAGSLYFVDVNRLLKWVILHGYLLRAKCGCSSKSAGPNNSDILISDFSPTY
jgi:hypothetical protein